VGISTSGNPNRVFAIFSDKYHRCTCTHIGNLSDAIGLYSVLEPTIAHFITDTVLAYMANKIHARIGQTQASASDGLICALATMF